MDKIKFQDINFAALQKLPQQGSTATIYRYGNTCVKILYRMHDDERAKLRDKLLDMDGISIENVILPKGLIMQGDDCFGYWMDYFPNSKCLTDSFNDRFVSVFNLLSCVFKASKTLRDIHDMGITYQDLNFENILVDTNGNIAFCDLDGCSYKTHTSSIIPRLMYNFFYSYRYEDFQSSPNMDRVTMMIALYYLIFGQEIQYLSNRQYNRLSRTIDTLDNMKQYFLMFKDKRHRINEVPYLDELISFDDSYVIDREEQLRLIRKVSRGANTWK